MTTLEDKLALLPPEDRAWVERRAAELIAEEMSLRDLRKARTKTQKKLARTLGIGQDSVSRLEKRSDMLLSTLASYVEAMGGTMKLVVSFKDRAPVELTGLGALDEGAPKRRRSARRAPQKAA